MPQLSPAQVQHVSSLVANYIRTQRQNFAARAVNLPAGMRVEVNPFFRPDVLNLNTTRVVVLENERVGNPDFYPMLYVKGFLEGGCYEAIPLELNAYGLEGNFRKAPHRGFSVEQEVAAWLQEEEEGEIDLG